jgi:bifunctional non-homologous end joining protein LigD
MADDLDPKQAFTPPASWGTDTILPEGFQPMLATSATAPLESPDYGYEVKWEGLRTLIGFERHKVFTRTAAGQDCQFWFPELEHLREAVRPAWVLMDGEMVVLENGRPSQALLQQRLRTQDFEAVERLAQEYPATFMASDVLRIGDSWLLDVNWEDRREILPRTLDLNEDLKISPAWQDGPGALQTARALGLEAVMGKRLRGRYYPGDRTRDWLSIRPLEVVDAVICGWTEGRGARSGTVGSLLLGVYRDGELTYVGHTGTGLGAQTLPLIHREMVRLGVYSCPFTSTPALTTEPHWVRPLLVCRIRHQGWTEAGHMRAPTFMELADDRLPEECLWMAAAPGCAK